MAQTPIASESASLSVWNFPAIFPLCCQMAGIEDTIMNILKHYTAVWTP